jgi:hypothetical protein
MSNPTGRPIPPGDSTEQQNAEALMLAALSAQIGTDLAPRKIPLPEGSLLAIDGVSDEPPVLCEAFAHQGKLKSGQSKKVASDALKLAVAARLALLPGEPRLILLFSDPVAAASYVGKSWTAQALRSFGIEVVVIELPNDVRTELLQAQNRQRR